MVVSHMRIDDRLIHGQIVTAWISDSKAGEILVADDMAAKDPTQQMLLKGAFILRVLMWGISVMPVQRWGENAFCLIFT